MSRANLASFFEEHTRRGRGIAFAGPVGLRIKRWSYDRLRKTTFQFARELETRGIGRGERVMLWGENGPEWVAAFFGCLLRGAIVVPLDIESAPDFVARVHRQTGSRLLLYGVRRCSVNLAGTSALALESLPESIAHHSSERYAPENISRDDPLEIIYTSGTTAEPKGVVITHGNMLSNLEPLEGEIKKYIKYERPFHPVRFLCLLPLSHVFGQFMGMLVPQIIGGEVHFLDSFSPAHIIETAKRERVSVLVTVPRMMDSLRAKIERDYDSRGELEKFEELLERSESWSAQKRWWKFRRVHREFGLKFWAFVSGGAALNPRTEHFWRRLGFAVIQGYGMTETAALVSVNHPFKTGRGSIGKLMPGQELMLDETGEILVRGPNVSPGYWGDGLRPVASEQGWLRTGDVAEMDESGNLYFKGRKKDVIVTAAGMNVHPDDLESALKAQPEVMDCAVVAVETPQGPEPLAALLLKDESANAGEVVGRANRLLSQHQHIRRWVVWPEEDFPRTTTQKIRKREVLEMIKDDLKFENSDLRSSSILREIARVTNESPQGVSAAANLATDLRLDSLGRVELLGALEDRYQIDIDETALTDATTVADLRRLVHKAARRGALEYPYPYWARKWPVTWIRFAVYYLLMLPAIWIMGRPRISGREHLRGLSGPVLLVSNHIVMVDQSLIQAALPARFRHRMAIAMDGEKLRGWRHPEVGTPFFRRLPGLIEYALVASLFNVFSLPLKSGFRRSFRYAGEAMDKGYSVLVFPEGERTKDGNIGRFREGTGLLAAELGAPVVPLKIEGLFEMKAQGRYFARPGELRVKVGEPVRYATSEDPAFITRDLERRVSQL